MHSGTKVSILAKEITFFWLRSHYQGWEFFFDFGFFFPDLFKAEIKWTDLIIIGSVLWQAQYLFPSSGS